MVGGFAVDAALVLAFLILVELLEAIFGIGIILDVVALVLLNVTLVLKSECAAWTSEKSTDGSYEEGLDLSTSQWRNDNLGWLSHTGAA